MPDAQLCVYSGDMTLTADLTSALERTESALGPFDIVIANVGGGDQAIGYRFDDAQWDAVIQKNLTGAVRLMREAIRCFRARPEVDQRVGTSSRCPRSPASMRWVRCSRTAPARQR